MTRNLKALGLALLAVFALGAVAASAASAEGTDVKTDHFTSEEEPWVITGEKAGTEEENFFGIKKIAALKVQCKKVTYAGTVGAKAVTTVTVVPTYFECSSNLGSAKVTNEVKENKACAFELTGTTDEHFNTEETKKETHATVNLECATERVITLETGGCTFFFGSVSGGNPVNQGLLGVTYTNEGSGPTKDVKVDITVDKIHYTTDNAFACQLAGIPETGTDGFLTGKATVKGFKDQSGAHTDYQDTFKDEGQVGIEVS
jgi:hypothetical protein